MLKGIKDMIKRKQHFQEEAGIIFENAVDSYIDDFIILEADDGDIESDSEEDEDVENPEKNTLSNDNNQKELDDIPLDNQEEDKGDDEDNKDDEEVDDDSIMDTPLTGDNEEEGEELDKGIDPMNMSLSGDEDYLPEPIGAQTGEPVNDSIDDILNTTLDLKTNTFTDVLPVPPPNAGDAVVGGADNDIMNTRIDSGFADEESIGSLSSSIEDTPLTPTSLGTEEGEDSMDGMSLDSNDEEPATETPDDPMDMSIQGEEDVNTESTLFEGITLGGMDPGTNPPPSETSPPTNDASAAPDANMGASETENDVTSAVRDKVAEADIDDTSLDDGIELGGSDTGALTGREELQDRLDKLNSSILDTKELVKKYVQS